MPITASQFDQIVFYSLRVELINGRVLIYRIDAENRQYLINKLAMNSEGYEENNSIVFLLFETSLGRQVMINTTEIIRVTFLIDYFQDADDARSYYDNFKVLEKETFLVPKETADGDTRLYVLDEEYLPQAIVYHRGKSPEDDYDGNPLLYFGLNEGCLGTLALELDNEIPLRQFVNLTDNDGEETFIPLQQIILIEFDKNLLYDSEQEEAFQEEFNFDEEPDETFDGNPLFNGIQLEVFDTNPLFEEPGDMLKGNPPHDEEPGEKYGENRRKERNPGKATEGDGGEE